MRTEINFTTNDGTNYDALVSAKLIGTTDEFANGTVYKYRVAVSVEGKRTSFVYHTSINDFNDEKNEMDEKDLQFALYCFLSDAVAANDSFENFCYELGYDKDSRKAYKIYKACKASKDKAEKLFHDIYEAVNAVNELENA